MDPLIYVCGVVVVAIILIAVTFIRKPRQEVEAEAAPNVGQIPARGRVEAGPAGRRNARRRIGAPVHRDVESDEEEDTAETLAPMDGKVGAKKLAKLQAKEERRRQNEAVAAEREERKKMEATRDAIRKKEEERAEAEEAAREEQASLEREQREKEEHEEYLKMKTAFSVEEEGEDAQTEEQTQNLLQEFINYIKDMKVVMLEDIASHFKIKTQDAIDRISTLLEEEMLSGVMDDRGKFIYITRSEYEEVAKFIKQRGRVSITELAESSNKLINLNPDKEAIHKKMMPVNV